MAKSRAEFFDLLIQKGILAPDQPTEARGMAQQTGAKLQDTLNHGRDPLNGEHARALIESLRKEFRGLEETATATGPSMEPLVSDLSIRKKAQERVQAHLEKIEIKDLHLAKGIRFAGCGYDAEFIRQSRTRPRQSATATRPTPIRCFLTISTLRPIAE